MSGSDVVRGVGWHWLILETGANQAFVFASNRQAVNVGASELITRLATWVHQAPAMAGNEIDPVVLASGKALVLVRDPQAGTALIRQVTTRALQEAPGLEVWGYVDHRPIREEAEIGEALTRALRGHAAWRSQRPATGLRHPTLPFTQPCRYSGLPAVTLGWDGEAIQPRAAGVDLAWRNCKHARQGLAQQLGDAAIVRPDRLNDGVTDAGWVAVVHADGNGVGEVFRRLGEAYRTVEFLTRLSSFSHALDTVTRLALKAAVERVQREREPTPGWLLPLVLGGDDVTVVVDARFGYALTVAFIKEFAEHCANERAVTEVMSAVAACEVLTASAGIAYVKPHHSFAEAYQLAEALCTSAKRVKQVAPSCGALDFHVLHDSVGSDLERTRSPLVVPADASGGELRLWAGPMVVPTPTAATPLHPWIDAHHYERLAAAVTGLQPSPDEPPLLSRTQAHTLREALTQGGWMVDRATHRVLDVAITAAERARIESYLAEHLVIDEPSTDDALSPGPGTGEARVAEDDQQPGGPAQFSRLISAIDLWDVTEGTTTATHGHGAATPSAGAR